MNNRAEFCIYLNTEDNKNTITFDIKGDEQAFSEMCNSIVEMNIIEVISLIHTMSNFMKSEEKLKAKKKP